MQRGILLMGESKKGRSCWTSSKERESVLGCCRAYLAACSVMAVIIPLWLFSSYYISPTPLAIPIYRNGTLIDCHGNLFRNGHGNLLDVCIAAGSPFVVVYLVTPIVLLIILFEVSGDRIIFLRSVMQCFFLMMFLTLVYLVTRFYPFLGYLLTSKQLGPSKS